MKQDPCAPAAVDLAARGSMAAKHLFAANELGLFETLADNGGGRARRQRAGRPRAQHPRLRPTGERGPRLVAVEYASWEPASLFGRAFDAPGATGPSLYTLHAWVWQGNPDGTFAARNPNVACA